MKHVRPAVYSSNVQKSVFYSDYCVTVVSIKFSLNKTETQLQIIPEMNR